MEGLESTRAYLDGLVCITKRWFQDHLQHLEQVLTRLYTAGLKVYIGKKITM